MDVYNIFSAIDIGIDLILKKIHMLFKTHSIIEESKEYKNVINVVRNCSKRNLNCRVCQKLIYNFSFS